MKKAIIILTVIAVVAFVLAAFSLFLNERQSEQLSDYVIERVERETFISAVEANGIVKSDQAALLIWKIPGEVESIFVEPGYHVSKGDVLALLDEDTLPGYIVAARAELISAQRALENLLNTETQRAQALKAVDDAEAALDEALHPEAVQAEALSRLADAQEALDVAQRNYEIVTAPVPQSAIDQAYANLLLAENKIAETEQAIVDAKNRDNRVIANSDLLPAETVDDLRHDLRRLLKQLEILLAQDRLAYEQSLARYNALLAPPDPVEVDLVESELAFATANLEEAQREWDRIKDGFSPAEIAVLEAELDDALRAWERLKDGPHPDDIAVLEAQIAAAEAAIAQMNITAPFGGTITRVHSQVHDIVDVGTLAFQLDDLSKLSVELSISEVDLGQVKLGQKVNLTFDAVPAKEYQGEIMNISSVGTRFLGATNFQVRIEIINPDEDIRPGMTSRVRIIVDEVENAIAVPGRAIRGLEGDLVVYRLVERGSSRFPSLAWREDPGVQDGSSFPLTLQRSVNYELEPVTIKLGKTSSNSSEILDGDLKEGDLIVLNPPK
jgi:HlyD family secretion protein